MAKKAPTRGRLHKVEIYRDNRGEWRWRLRAGNGRIIADGGEGYTRKAAALNGMMRVGAVFAHGPVRIEEVDA